MHKLGRTLRMDLVKADGTGQTVNLTQSGFNDARAKWILDGKAMLWFSNRDGLKSVAQSGSSIAITVSCPDAISASMGSADSR